MPVFGYLAIPKKGAVKQLHNDLSSLPHCEIIPAQNRDLVVLVTDTPNDAMEQALQQRLRQLDSLQSLSMTFGHTDDPSTIQPERKP